VASDSNKPTLDLAASEEMTREELEATIARLEVQANRQIVLQQELIVARDQLDQELMRFRALADYIGQALAVEDPAEFRTLTLESLIEAFEFEMALFLGYQDPGALHVLDHFGFEVSPPATLPWDPAWAGDGAMIYGDDDVLLEAWSALGMCAVICCAYHDNEGAFRGIIAGGISSANREQYSPIGAEMQASFRLMVEQAGSMQVRHLLNQEMAALTESYSRFVPFEFLQLLGRGSILDIGVGDQIGLDMAVLFCDLRGFTGLTESIPADEAFAVLNDYLAAMEPPIRENQGFINQYQGDAIMALFATGADAAVDAAIGMNRALDAFNEERIRDGLAALHTGVGVHFGPLMLGAIGGSRRLEPNVVGDTANLASRTEGMTKFYGAKLIITEPTMVALSGSNAPMLRELDQVVVMGRKQPIAIYEVLDVDSPSLREKKIAYQASFARGLELYREGEFRQARLSFMECVLQAPDDGAANLYVDRCGELARRPPFTWAGVTTLDDK
jgi:class 3 adenylate cyclase